MSRTVVIVGAGVGGIASAALLARAGYEVAVYEAADQTGARAGWFETDGFSFDTGPSWYLMPEVFERYFNLLGTTTAEQLELIRLTPAYKVYFEADEPITISGDLAIDRQTFENREAGAGRRLEKYVSASRQRYRLALDHFLYSNFRSPLTLLKPAVLRHAGQLLTMLLTPLHSYVRHFVTRPALQQILEYPMVFLGSSPYTAPALYSLMSALDFGDGVYYPKGTMYQLVRRLQALAEASGVRFYLNSPVTAITSQAGKASGVTLADGRTITADIVISNADLHYTETALLKAADQTYPESYWQHRQAGPSALLMYLGVSGAIPEFEHHTLLFADDWQTNFATIAGGGTPQPASLYISKTSQTDDTAPAGDENIFVLVPLGAGVSLTLDQTEQLADQYLAQIKTMTGVDLLSRTVNRRIVGPDDFGDRFHAWRNTMLGPSHILRQSAFFRIPNRSRKLNNLFYVGAGTVPGIGLPMCLISAELVFERITGRRPILPTRKGTDS